MCSSDLARGLEQRKCFFTDRNNYFVIELPDALPAGFQYWVFFDVRGISDPDAVLLFIQSAYAREAKMTPRGRKAEKVGFRVLVSKALDGRRAKRPP